MISRQHILNEIRRSAHENNGVPLGQTRFENQTGIGQTDWGRFWPRWGDALREAGFKPNEFQAAYDDEILMDRYIQLTRRLGKLPTRAELIVQRHTDPEFPSHGAYRRWGNKQKIVEKVRNYCEGREEYADVLHLCAAVPIAEEVEVPPNAPKGEDGYVYLIRSGRYFKIGKSNAAGRREYELAIQLPEKPKTVHVIKTDDPSGIEAYWHKRFESKRKGGEWFDLDGADVQAFKRRKFM
jgi:hypothetical protein